MNPRVLRRSTRSAVRSPRVCYGYARHHVPENPLGSRRREAHTTGLETWWAASPLTVLLSRTTTRRRQHGSSQRTPWSACEPTCIPPDRPDPTSHAAGTRCAQSGPDDGRDAKTAARLQASGSGGATRPGRVASERQQTAAPTRPSRRTRARAAVRTQPDRDDRKVAETLVHRRRV